MFCSKCGAPIPEQVRFCPTCGSPVEQPQPQAQQPVSFVKPMGRLKFNYTRGGAVSWIGFAALILAVVLVCVSGYKALYGSIMEWAVIETLEDVPDNPVEDLENALEDGQQVVDESRQKLDEIKREHEDLTEEEEGYVEIAEELVDDLEEILDEPSMMAINGMLNQFAENEDAFEILEKAEGETSALELRNELKDLQDVMSVVVGVTFGCFGLCILLTFLAAMFRSNVLTVFGMLGALILCAPFGGGLIELAVLVLYVTAIVLNAVLRKHYKTYKHRF